MAEYACVYDCFDSEEMAERYPFRMKHDDLPLHALLGDFVLWYANAELALTELLRIGLKIKDAKAFELLVSGMDARVKIERFKAASGDAWGPRFTKRMEHFRKVLVPLRNRLLHNRVVLSGDDVHIVTIVQMHDQTLPPAFSYPAKEIHERTLWLKLFSQDALEAGVAYLQTGTVERDEYLSGLPTGSRQTPTQKARHAKSDKRARKEAREKKDQ